jgi:HSP20 family molecular chaperone IbpA
MSHCSSFTTTYPSYCLLDYEKLQHRLHHQQASDMDHYQTHTYPLPTSPPTHTYTHTHTTSWSPSHPFHFPQTWDWHHPHSTVHPHPANIPHSHYIRETLSSLAHPPIYFPSFSTSAFTPRTNIRETPTAYHIEIELPGVTNKAATEIEWREGGVLIVSGVVGGSTSKDGSEKNSSKDEDWCALSPTHATDTLTNENPLERTPDTVKQEAAREEPAAAVAAAGASPACSCQHLASAPTYLLQERPAGAWQRRFTLPGDGDLRGMKVVLKEGVLEIAVERIKGNGGRGEGRVAVQ